VRGVRGMRTRTHSGAARRARGTASSSEATGGAEGITEGESQSETDNEKS